MQKTVISLKNGSTKEGSLIEFQPDLGDTSIIFQSDNMEKPEEIPLSEIESCITRKTNLNQGLVESIEEVDHLQLAKKAGWNEKLDINFAGKAVISVGLVKDMKFCLSKHYNYAMNVRTGGFARWGKTKDHDPIMSVLGPELADIEISTICHGINGKPCKFCFPDDTLINTIKGGIPIQDLKVGDTVISCIKSKHKPYARTNRIEEIYEHDYKGDLIVITLEDNRTLKVTPNHPIFLENGREVNAGDLTESDEIRVLESFKHCKSCNQLILMNQAFERYYCSEECYIKHKFRKCLICGKLYISKWDQRRFCCIDFEGYRDHPLRNTYESMLGRCYDPKTISYKHYGAKNLRVDKRWFSFKNFIEDIGPRPEGYTLDRIDNDKGYSPENCRWVSIEEQRINRKRFKTSKRKYKGVSPHGRKWKAEIRFRNKGYYLGVFDTEEQAALTYNAKLQEFYPANYQDYMNKIEEEAHYED